MIRFVVPPGWPPPPAGWKPPYGWEPDPQWGPPPAGWSFWQEKTDQPSTETYETQEAPECGSMGEDLSGGPSRYEGTIRIAKMLITRTQTLQVMSTVPMESCQDNSYAGIFCGSTRTLDSYQDMQCNCGIGQGHQKLEMWSR